MKPGTELKHLAIFKNQDTPKVLESEQYPEWVSSLVKGNGLESLAALRKIPNEQATESQIKRYLKLTRRLAIRSQNEQAAT
jgi:hypothetical protein